MTTLTRLLFPVLVFWMSNNEGVHSLSCYKCEHYKVDDYSYINEQVRNYFLQKSDPVCKGLDGQVAVTECGAMYLRCGVIKGYVNIGGISGQSGVVGVEVYTRDCIQGYEDAVCEDDDSALQQKVVKEIGSDLGAAVYIQSSDGEACYCSSDLCRADHGCATCVGSWVYVVAGSLVLLLVLLGTLCCCCCCACCSACCTCCRRRPVRAPTHFVHHETVIQPVAIGSAGQFQYQRFSEEPPPYPGAVYQLHGPPGYDHPTPDNNAAHLEHGCDSSIYAPRTQGATNNRFSEMKY